MYYFDSRVRFSETDRDQALTLEAVVDYFQDCSTFQSEDLGVGIHPLTERDLVWVLSYWQIVVDEYPHLGDPVRICTHPHEFRGFMGLRNFYMKDKEDRMLIRANSLWTLLNRRTMRPVRVPEDIQEAYVLEEKIEMDYAPRKIAVTGEGRQEAPLRVEKHHLDCNNHVNNGQYIRIAAAFLPDERPVRQLRAEYRMQARLGDMICPVCYENGDVTIITLCNEQGDPYTVIEFQKEGKISC